MILEAGKNGAYVLTVGRGEADIEEIVKGHGWDYSESASSGSEAVLFTREPYAAMTFADYASPALLGEFAEAMEHIEASWSDSSDRHIDSPPDVELWPFQRAGVEYCLSRTHALIGDQPGLGKTAQAICLANEMRAKRTLVVCPANIRLQWQKAIHVWSTLKRPVVYPILKGRDGTHPAANFTIISYDLTRSPTMMQALTKNMHYDLLVMDEAHYLKSPEAKRTQFVIGDNGLMGHAEKAVALTGTPLPNRPKECYTLARALCWSAINFMSEDDFKFRFNPSQRMFARDPENPEGRTKTWTKESVGRLPELQNRLRSNFMIRRLKRQVLPQLPDVRFEIQHVEETGEVRRALMAERMLEIDPENLRGLDAKILGDVSTVRRMMGVAKAPQVADYVRMLIDGGEEKLVVFAWHIEVLDILERALADLGVLRIDGRTPPSRRQAHVEEFQTNGRKRIMIGNLQAMGIGTDGLQNVCSHAIFAECSWVSGDNEQGVGRLERIGQLTGILAEFMVAPGSFDERVLGTALRKMRTVHSALDKEHA